MSPLRVGDTPDVASPVPPPMTRTLDTVISVDVMLATPTLQKEGENALDRFFTFPIERKYRQLSKNERKDISGTHLNSTPYGQPPSKPCSDHHSDYCLYFGPVLLQLETWPEAHSKTMDRGPRSMTSFQASNCKPEDLLQLILPPHLSLICTVQAPSVPPQYHSSATQK